LNSGRVSVFAGNGRIEEKDAGDDLAGVLRVRDALEGQ
jgi:hypothetical protein